MYIDPIWFSASVIRNHRKARNSEPRRTLAHPPRREQDRQLALWSYFWPHAHHPALRTCTRDLSFRSPRLTTRTSLPSEAGWEAGRRGQVGNDSQKDLRTSTHYLAHSAPRSLKRQHDLQGKKHWPRSYETRVQFYSRDNPALSPHLQSRDNTFPRAIEVSSWNGPILQVR